MDVHDGEVGGNIFPCRVGDSGGDVQAWYVGSTSILEMVMQGWSGNNLSFTGRSVAVVEEDGYAFVMERQLKRRKLANLVFRYMTNEKIIGIY